jgi:hypothetical protein
MRVLAPPANTSCSPSFRHVRRASAAAGWILDEKIGVSGVAVDVGVDERAQRDHAESTLARVIQCAGDERGAETLAMQFLIDLGVEERTNVAAAIPVNELSRVLAADQQLISAVIRPMRNGDVVGVHLVDATRSGIRPCRRAGSCGGATFGAVLP